ncbi:nonstructural protein [Microvirus mar27]|uniref:Nonstructural protein n=1 Tax=Microvirus mar27 TaxID=2851160 RepID=A0A8F5XS08_9VIRU|nr:nonstructural protein [Microvirus mar27]
MNCSKLFMYVVYDRTANMYTAPMLAQNEACARRDFKQMMKETKFSPSEFDLCKLGFFHPEKATIDYEFELLENGGAVGFDDEKELLDGSQQ